MRRRSAGRKGGKASPAVASSPSSSAIPQEKASGTFPRTIEAANGSIVIQKKPERVAVVHWGYVDSLLLFDLPSVGLALPFTKENSSLKTEAYKPFTDKIKDISIVGENTAVNMEALQQYAPDLIIAGNKVNAEISDQLAKIATTVVIDETATDVWSDWPKLVTKFGKMLGQEQTADQFITGYQAKVQDAKAKLADVKGTIAFLQVRDNAIWLGGTKFLTPYYDNGLGFKAPDNSLMTEGAEMSLEGLAALNPDHVILGYFNYEDQSKAALLEEWKKNPVWQKLKAVQNNQTYAVNGALAMGYVPIGNSYGVDAVLKALSK
ncbi:ABC transporter substrate-binding protein [Paenibacillus athensensis]|uniref:ABC transporter substrate-binding protein n=1 Tax=Paenibacillus athensensis TaxID=1967502 RepID=UPI001E419BF6|nr:ABC transporter substrate-binding protein [Paenibacillus athensensis]